MPMSDGAISHVIRTLPGCIRVKTELMKEDLPDPADPRHNSINLSAPMAPGSPDGV